MKIYENILENLINEVRKENRKCFGYLVSDNKENIVSDYYIFKGDNRRKDNMKEHFEEIGNYYIDNSDAGFLAPPGEMIELENMLLKMGLHKIAAFHLHRRHPDVFTIADWNMHPSSRLKHLVISLRNKYVPKYKLFKVNKETSEYSKMFAEENIEEVPSSNTHISIDNFNINFLNDYNKKTLVSLLKMSSPRKVNKFWNKYNTGDRERLRDSNKYNDQNIKKTLVTNSEYKCFKKWHEWDDSYPVVNVDYYDAYLFSSWVGGKLLTEKEWEFYKDGHTGGKIFSHKNKLLEKYAYYSQNSKGKIHKVAELSPNKFGLYDMEGDVWEWCDGNDKNGYTKGGSFRAFPEMMIDNFSLEERKNANYYDLGFRYKLKEAGENDSSL